MSIIIDSEKCTGCPKAQEAPCIRVCPGDLLLKRDGTASIRDPEGCWDCAACLKSCPNQAIAMFLPIQIGGKGATLRAKTLKDKIIWTCKWPNGKKEIFEVETEKII